MTGLLLPENCSNLFENYSNGRSSPRHPYPYGFYARLKIDMQRDFLRAGEADAQSEVQRKAGPFKWPLFRHWHCHRAVGSRAGFRFVNHELHGAISASCICRKSTGGFFL
jgi:hypothetical protein